MSSQPTLNAVSRSRRLTLVRTASVATILVAGALRAGAQRQWVEVTGPHVSVLSDAGDGQARNIAWQFEQVREAGLARGGAFAHQPAEQILRRGAHGRRL